jgi:hypothetical protein
MNLATHTSHGDPNFEQWIAAMKAAFVSQGYDAATAAQKALALAYHTVQAQANAISFQSSFWVMSLIVACLARFPSSCGALSPAGANRLCPTNSRGATSAR